MLIKKGSYMSNIYNSGQPYDENEVLPLPAAYYESRPPYPVSDYNSPPPPRQLSQPYYPQLQSYYPPPPQTHIVYHVGLPTYSCPFCRSPYPPLLSQRISTGGWVTFAILLIIFFPLCWIGFLMKATYQYCGQCQARLS